MEKYEIITYDTQNYCKREIVFNDDFNESLDSYIDIIYTCDSLELGRTFDKQITNLPNSIKKLILRSEKYSHDIVNLPLELKELILFSDLLTNIKSLPHGLEKIVYNFYNKISDIYFDILPISVKIIEFGVYALINVDELEKIPNHIEQLIIREFSFTPLEDDDPQQTFKFIKIDDDDKFTQKIPEKIKLPNKIPEQLKTIELLRHNQSEYVYDYHVAGEYDAYAAGYELFIARINELNPFVEIKEI